MSLIDHVEFAVRDAEVSRHFYERALSPLGVACIVSVGPAQTRTGGTRHGFGKHGYPSLWVHDGEASGSGTHVALVATTRALVDAFHREAIAAGGTDNGAPEIRSHYHANYYAAYVLDPDGVNVEVVCQRDNSTA